MTRIVRTTPESLAAANNILSLPCQPPGRGIRDGACVDAIPEELPQDANSPAEIARRGKAFVAEYCGPCSVAAQCARLMVDLPECPRNVCYGGFEPADVSKIWASAAAIRSKGGVDVGGAASKLGIELAGVVPTPPSGWSYADAQS